MFDPVVDLFRETGRIFVDEKRFFVDGEILRRALLESATIGTSPQEIASMQEIDSISTSAGWQ